jgi:drug/metabolite transporter (DMT)-like permease
MSASVLALLGACAFALGTVLQQKGALEVPAGEDDPRFLVQVLRRPVWLAGGALQVAGWLLQAVALDRGSFIVVQALTALSLVIALPFGVRLTAQEVTPRVWFGAGALVVGIVLFLSVGQPQGSTSSPSASEWWSAGISAAIAIALLTVAALRRRGAARALLFGSAAGVCFAFQAAVTKVFVPLVGKGVHAIVTSWTVYALLVSALVGFALQQSALKTGVLAPATSASNAATLFGSALLASTVFGEELSGGQGRLGPAVLGLGLAMSGMVLLAGAKPPSPAAPASP